MTVVDGNSRLIGTSIASSSTSTSPLAVPDKGVTYTVTVTAVNKVGPSTPASRMFYFAGRPLSVHHTEQCHWCGACGVNVTLSLALLQFSNAVPESPQSVAVTAVSGSELKVSWTAPNQPADVPHSPTLGYTVSWKVEGREEDSHNITGALNTIYQITRLAQGTRYTVNVTAHNSVGKSAAATGSGTTFNGKWSMCACSN